MAVVLPGGCIVRLRPGTLLLSERQSARRRDRVRLRVVRRGPRAAQGQTERLLPRVSSPTRPQGSTSRVPAESVAPPCDRSPDQLLRGHRDTQWH
jgi:hypothetical protein